MLFIPISICFVSAVRVEIVPLPLPSTNYGANENGAFLIC